MAPSVHAAFDNQAGVERYGDKAPAGSTGPVQVIGCLLSFGTDNTPAANNQAVCKTHEDRVGNFAFSFGLPGAMFFSQVDAELLTGYIEHKILQLDL